jgi:hypothetical protein
VNHLSRDIGNGAPGHSITDAAGRTFRFRFIDGAMEAAFQSALFAAARERLRARKADIVEDLGEAAYRSRLESLYQDYDRLEFSLQNPKNLSHPGSVNLLISLMLGASAEEVAALREEQNHEVMRLFMLVFKESHGGEAIREEAEKNSPAASSAPTARSTTGTTTSGRSS